MKAAAIAALEHDMKKNRKDVASAKDEARTGTTQTADARVVVPFASQRKPAPPIPGEEDPEPPSAA